MHRPSPRTAALVATLLLLALVGFTPSSAATLRTTTVTGFASAPTTAKAGSVWTAAVRVNGGSRPVQLQRRVDGAWRLVAAARSSSTGRVTLRWLTPMKTVKVALRVNVPRRNAWRSATTGVRWVQVRRALGDVVQVVLTPLLQDVLSLVNDARASGHTCGGVSYPSVPRVSEDARLTSAAGKYARLMASRDFFSHTSPDGSSPGDRIEAEGYNWRSYGENIAAGQSSAAEVVRSWLASAGHCANLMSRSFTEIGLGYAYDADSTYGRYWVQDFASR